MFITYFCTKFHLPSSSGLLVIANKPKAEYGIHTAVILLFCVHPTRNYLGSSSLFFFKLCYHLTSSRARHVVVTDYRKLKYKMVGVTSNRITFTLNLMKIGQFVRKLNGNTHRGNLLIS
jgi:hypothetical protein